MAEYQKNERPVVPAVSTRVSMCASLFAFLALKYILVLASSCFTVWGILHVFLLKISDWQMNICMLCDDTTITVLQLSGG